MPKPLARTDVLRFALSGDLVDSRKLSDRQAFPNTLSKVLANVNTRFAEHFHAKIVVTRGIDEVSAVLNSLKPLPSVIFSLNTELWPQSFRFGIGIGPIDVADQTNDAHRMDGPAFHQAADALEYGKKHRIPVRFSSAREIPASLRLVESSLSLAHAVMGEWTQRQNEIIKKKRAKNGLDTDLAEDMGISKQAISKALQRGFFKELECLESALQRQLSEVYWPE